MVYLFVVLISAGGTPFNPQTPGADMPPELQRMQAYRAKAFDRARFEWHEDDNGVVGYNTSQYAGNDFLRIAHGSETGLQNIYMDGLAYAYSERFSLYKDGQQWNYTEEKSRMLVLDADAPEGVFEEQTDLRTAGLYPRPRTQLGPRCRALESYLSCMLAPPSGGYDVTHTPDGLVEVRGHFGEGTVMWRLDPEREYQPIVVESAYPNEEGSMLVEQAYTSYMKINGKFIPERIEYVMGNGARDILTVDSALIDDPELPSELRVADFFPLMQGVNISHVDASGKGRLEIWDGERAATKEEVAEMKRQGLFDNIPFILRYRELRANVGKPNSKPKLDGEGWYATANLSRTPGLWENFTRRFIAVANLDKNQTKRAWEHLGKCQSAANKKLPDIRKQAKDIEWELTRLRIYGDISPGVRPISKSDDLADVETEAPSSVPAPVAERTLATTGGEGSAGKAIRPSVGRPPDTQATAERTARLNERLSELYKPIEAIFEHDLKPGLNKLLTPEQNKLIARHDAEVKARTNSQN